MRAGSLGRLTAVACAVVLALAGCTGSGDSPTPPPSASQAPGELRPELEPFDALVVSAPFQVELSTGEEAALVISTDPEAAAQVTAEVADGTLTLGFDGTTSSTLLADLVVPADALRSIELAGAAVLQGGGTLRGGDLALGLNGAASLTLPVSADSLQLTVDGASEATMSGEAGSTRVTANGSAMVDLSEFAAGDADVTATGASTVSIAVTGALVANASGASSIRYSGAPTSVTPNADITSTIEAG